MRSELNERKRAAVLGALVADAASLGFHWLYDQDRIRELAPEDHCFRVPDPADYSGVSGYFAHETKQVGELSQYGEQARVLLECLGETGGQFKQSVYQSRFQQFFGYGGGYVGYIDHATRETLNRMEASDLDPMESPAGVYFGADDIQLPAISKLPALVAFFAGHPELKGVVESAVRVTNNNDKAEAYGWAVSRAIEAAILTASPELACTAGRQAATEEIMQELSPAFESADQSSADFSAQLGLSCELKFGVVSVLHQLQNVESYAASVRDNVWIGGDSCGRAIFLGSVLGASFGIGGDYGIPESWLEQLRGREEIEKWLSCVLEAQSEER